ncbi:MAG: 4-(cytidine 5'-diphospho)-2-C-methyl-D-erythritol kinase, partial [Wolbachia sp.]
FDSEESAKAAAANIKKEYLEWWVCDTELMV